MNYKVVINTLGWIFLLEAILLLVPTGVALCYAESLSPFLITIAILVFFFGLCRLVKPTDKSIYARDGFVIVVLSWLLMSVFGSIPFMISGVIPNFVDAFFETVSGFTTTGATIMPNVEVGVMGVMFWRSFTHWIGGMGVLVFMLAIIPMTKMRGVYIMRAEVTGPTKSKLLPKLQSTAKVLYSIYIVLTLIQVVFLLAGGMNLYDSFVHAFGTAGTGGFSVKAASIAAYNSVYLETVIAVFMILFGINFSVFYMILIHNVKSILKNEELWAYLGIIAFATITIAINILHMTNNFAESLRLSFFQVSSIITTTGYATTDFNLWPTYSKFVLIILMFFGACAGSTGGGMKIIRFIILGRVAKKEFKRLIHPKSVNVIKANNEVLDDTIIHSTLIYISIFFVITFASVLLITIEGHDFETSFTSVVTCINNIGPGLGKTGPVGNFAFFSVPSKILLSLNMLMGRLELFPFLVVLMPSTWKSRNRKNK